MTESPSLTALKTLAARVDSEPASRALDVAIADALGITTLPLQAAVGHDDGCWLRRIGDNWVEIGSHANSGTSTRDRYVPRYTSSRDAAAMLMPEGWELQMYADGQGTTAFASHPKTQVVGKASGFDAEARARCAAALRARS